MKLEAGIQLWWSGEKLQVLFIDSHHALLECVDTHGRKLVPLESIHQAIADECVMVAKDEAKYTRDADWYQALSARQQKLIGVRIKYAEYFSRNIVKVSQQRQIIQSISSAFGHAGSLPAPSTVRRWAQRYRASNEDIASLLDNRLGGLTGEMKTSS